MSDVAQRVAENLDQVRQRISAAAKRSGREPGLVRLVAVTKYGSDEAVRALLDGGCRDLGESRPQQLWTRAEQFAGDDVVWHLIGHLQRNKARRTLPLTSLVHSVDSLRLLEALDETALSLDLRPRVLIEVNISGDPAKHGFAPSDLPALAPRLAELGRVQVVGLMAMAARSGDADKARASFAALRELRDRLRDEFPANATLDELSMGMSGDFEAAIEEGSTLVRVGSTLLEGVGEG